MDKPPIQNHRAESELWDLGWQHEKIGFFAHAETRRRSGLQ